MRITSGRAIRIRLWLDDGETESVLTVAGGLASPVTLGVVPQREGSFRLWATAFDALGCQQTTGVIRIVQVTVQ